MVEDSEGYLVTHANDDDFMFHAAHEAGRTFSILLDTLKNEGKLLAFKKWMEHKYPNFPQNETEA